MQIRIVVLTANSKTMPAHSFDESHLGRSAFASLRRRPASQGGRCKAIAYAQYRSRKFASLHSLSASNQSTAWQLDQNSCAELLSSPALDPLVGGVYRCAPL